MRASLDDAKFESDNAKTHLRELENSLGADCFTDPTTGLTEAGEQPPEACAEPLQAIADA
jgi:hypothetical protein